MPYRLKVEGMDEITEMLSQAAEAAPGIAARALYKGAGVVADEISKGARGLKTTRFRYANGWQRDPSPEEKEALVAAGAAGIAKFEQTGNEASTSVGYGRRGYVTINGKPKAVAVIANSINSGTSFMKKQPFIRKAVSQSKGKASQAIQDEIGRLVGEILK